MRLIAINHLTAQYISIKIAYSMFISSGGYI